MAEQPQAIDEYDPNTTPPEALLGIRVSVEWSGNRWYNGVIDDYDEKKQEHHVLYDDNDKRWYRMPEKTFRVLGSNKVFQALQAGTYTIFSKFIPYTPKDPNSRTLTTFHVLLDAKSVNVEAGERVCVRGSVPQLGEFERPGVALQQHPEMPHIWFGQTEMPFVYNESCQTGIFEYKFFIERNGEIVSTEARHNRRETVFRPHYYASFWPDVKGDVARFRQAGVTASISIKDCAAHSVVSGFVALVLGRLSAKEFMTRLHCISASFGNWARTHAEEVVAYLLKRPVGQGGLAGAEEQLRQRPEVLLCLLAIVGCHGLSAADKEEIVVSDGWMTVGEKKKKKRFKVEPWCTFVLDQFQTFESCSLDLKNRLGVHHIWSVIGLREAVERIGNSTAELGQGAAFVWLKVAPFLKAHKHLPDVHGSADVSVRAVKERFEEYLRVAYDLRVLAQAAFEAAEQERIVNQQMYNEEKAMALSQNKKFEKQPPGDPTSLVVARAYLWSLIRYVPSIDALCTLFIRPDRANEDLVALTSFMKSRSGELLEAVCQFVRAAIWSDTSELGTLSSLVEAVPHPFRHPSMASALLRNPTIDRVAAPDRSEKQLAEDAKFNQRILDFVNVCAYVDIPLPAPSASSASASASSVSASSASASSVNEEKKEGKDEKESIEAAGEMDAAELALVELESASKEWYRRNHSSEPVEEKKDKDKDKDSGGFMTGWNWLADKDKDKKKAPTPQELDAKRLKYLVRGVDAIDQLLRVPYFDSRPQGLVFEFSRCHFFKGDNITVLQAICSLARLTQGALASTEHIRWDFLPLSFIG